ncbi:MAG: sodium:alanine symporter family protein [Ruminococcus sp.]|nr:sodium:alanine symporter family protein [Ruminococcus sp.]
MAMFIQTINGYLWGFPMIAFLFSTHIFMSIKTGFVQRRVFKGIRLSVSAYEKGRGDMSPFASLATTLASTLGTGNIIGVGSAVALGGAGAVFWCWVTGVFGMATQYGECMLSVKFRTRNHRGEFCGGPMYVLRDGASSRGLGLFYAFLAALCGLVTGAAIQSNSISEIIISAVVGRSFKVSPTAVKVLVGIITATLASLVIFGGVKSVGRVCSFFVPFMAGAYILGCVAVLFVNRGVVLEALCLIIKDAFSLRALSGGAQGSALMLACRYGMARGLFSNEAGLGTSSVVCACAESKSPVRQGMISMTATFWDTVVMCFVTGVVIVSTELAVAGAVEVGTLEQGNLCLRAFCRIPYIGEWLLVFSMVTFAFSTVIGWYVVGEKCFTFVFGEGATAVYRVLWVLAVLVAPVCTLQGVWAVGDLVNALLVIPNVTGLVLLSGTVKKETREYFAKK